jgi:NAD(P)-dependent dehydrogenase (short-subunit alcohol dehydrogenase family)
MSDVDAGRRDITFTQEHLDLFSALSRDRNPLHLDPDHARRTPYARPVFFGVAGVLAALGIWADGRPFRLASLRAVFDQPLFTGIDYTVEWTGRDRRVELRILKGNQSRTRITFRWEDLGEPEGTAGAGPAFRPLTEARLRTRAELPVSPVTLDAYPYEPDWTQAGPFQERFGLALAQWPRQQLAGLLFASYFIGMDCPGSQALFADLKFSFDPAAGAGAAFQASGLTLGFDDRFSLLNVSGSGGSGCAFTLKAFLRPAPVVHSLAEVRAGVGAATAMSGQRVLITGASRGFGAVLAKTFALQGADVALNYRSGHTEAAAIQAELTPCPGRTVLLPGDLGRRDDCARVCTDAAARLGGLDLLVFNASPAIEAKPFLAQTAGEALGFVQDSLALLVNPLQELLPALQPGATVVYISSIYVLEPKAPFSHYLAAKGAAEGLLRGLAEEFKHLRFIILRPPRMLTDQTNTPYDQDPGVSPITVARNLLKALDDADATPGLSEL